MTEKSKKPRLRFKGFTEAWEQRELGKIGSTYTGLSGKSKADFGHGKGKFITYMNVFTNPIANLGTVEPIEIDDKQNTVLVGDVFFTTSSETPEEVGMSCVLTENSPNTYLNSFCFGYRPIVKFDNYYLAYMLRSASFRGKITFLAQGISRYNISKNKVMEIEIPIPDVNEQQKIGAYFRNIDNLITLHQRKYDKFVAIKKALLEKMFPRDGKNVPEIRFKGFTETWEQRKVNSIAERFYGGGTPSTLNEEFWQGDIAWVQSSDLIEHNVLNVVIRKRISEKAIKTSAAQLIPSNSIAIITRVGVGKVAFMPFSYATSQDFVSLSELKIDGVFATYLLYLRLQKDMNMVQGTSIKGITKEELLSKEIYIPNYRQEQSGIAYIFSRIDNLITLHQRQLERLKNIKSALLEKMFV